MRYPLGRSRYRWSDIDGDFVVTRGSVGFRLQPSARKTFLRFTLGGFQRAFTGCDGMIQASSFGSTPEELRRWLDAHRQTSTDQVPKPQV